MSEAYTDTTTTIAWFCVALIVITVIGLILMAFVGHIEAAYKATLMGLHERQRRRNGR